MLTASAGSRRWRSSPPPPASGTSASSSASASARTSTASGSGSGRWSRTARSSTSGTPTAAPAASRRTRTCRSTCTSRGYGVFVNHPGRGLVRDRDRGGVPGPVQRAGRVTGVPRHLRARRPKEILRKYGGADRPAGAAAAVVVRTLAEHLVHDRTTTRRPSPSFVDGMAERDLPLSVFHFDCFWMRELHWCDFNWDERTFPDPAGMLARLKDKGLHICVWINPYIAQRSPLFAEGAAGGYLLRKPDGDVWQTDKWQAGHGHRRLHQPGRPRVVCGQAAGPAGSWAWTASRPTSASGSPPTSSGPTAPTRSGCTTTTAISTTRACSSCCASQRGRTGGRACSPAPRPPAASSFPVHWGGDCESTFESMAESLRGGLSLAHVRLRILEPRHRRLRGTARSRRSTSAGSRSVCSARTAGCTAATAIACRGCSTRSRSMCCARSPD